MSPQDTALVDSLVEKKNTTLPLSTALVVAVWLGIVAGLVEGSLLLIFQRINWAQWARVLHVSKQILWISPVVDVCLFAAISLGIVALSHFAPRIPFLRLLILLLILLTVYDWLVTPERLYRRACLLLALGVTVAIHRFLKTRETSVIRMWKRSLPVVVLVFAIVFGAIRGGTWAHEKYATAHLPAARRGAPNVLVIVIDTLRGDHLSTYGYSRETSPNIDNLAREGVLFENAIAPSSWSLPSHASLVTGRPVHEHGLGNVEPMPWLGWGKHSLNGLPTLAEALTQSGYRTGAFSANRIYFTSNVGLGRGFLHFEDYFDVVGDCFIRTQFGREFARLYLNRSPKSKFTRAFRRLGLADWLDKDSEGSGEYGGAFGIRKRADEVNRETLRWIQQDPNHPFLAFLNYLDVHYSYGGPPGYPKPAWDRGTSLDEYDAGIQFVDNRIGQLLAALDRSGQLKNTVVVITSDHGESLGDHGLTYHGAALYRELVRVPLIISYPGHVPQRIRITQPVSNAAIASTMTKMAGGDTALFPGPTLDEYWESQQTNAGQSNWPPVVSELPQTNTIVSADRVMQGKEPLATDGWMESVITPQWQLITHEKDGDQLYDWSTDPGEHTNLANTPRGQGVTALLRKAARSCANCDQTHKFPRTN